MDALAKELVGCRVNSDPVACRGEVQDKYQGLNDSKTGAGLYGCKALGESACNDQYTAAKSGSAQVDSLLGSLALSAEERTYSLTFRTLITAMSVLLITRGCSRLGSSQVSPEEFLLAARRCLLR